jgi:hypothetical protein
MRMIHPRNLCPYHWTAFELKDTKRGTLFHGRIHHLLLSVLIFRTVQRCALSNVLEFSVNRVEGAISAFKISEAKTSFQIVRKMYIL